MRLPTLDRLVALWPLMSPESKADLIRSNPSLAHLVRRALNRKDR